MAEEEKQRRYSIMPIGLWWASRKRFRSTIPKKVTPGYLA
jgi:hypothetical protein